MKQSKALKNNWICMERLLLLRLTKKTRRNKAKAFMFTIKTISNLNLLEIAYRNSCLMEEQ